jgi:hypothetical protein
MKPFRLLIITFVIAIILGYAIYAPVFSQSTCASVGNVSVRYTVANIRGVSGNTTATPIGRLERGTSVPVMQPQANGWFPLCDKGYVSGDVVLLVTNTPTLTPTRTVTATRTLVPSATPTRVTGTQAAGKWYRIKESAWFFCPDGVTQSCGVPVEFEIYGGTGVP